MTYETLASDETVADTTSALRERGIEALVVETKEEALEKIKELVSAGASIMNGSSMTLQEIGYIDLLKSGAHAWRDLHAPIVAEKDPAKQASLRNEALFADYYLGSVHAIAETGEMIFASASGSQLPHLAYTSRHLILVAGTQKIVPTLDDAFARVRDYVFPLENKRMADSGMGGSVLAKMLLFEREPTFSQRTVHILFVKEKLGF